MLESLQSKKEPKMSKKINTTEKSFNTREEAKEAFERNLKMAMENTFEIKEPELEGFEMSNDSEEMEWIEKMEDIEKSFKEKYFRLLKAHYDLMDVIYGTSKNH
jgi:seryl-tRNA synthetase